MPAASVVPVDSSFSPESQSSSSHHDNDVVNTPAELDVFELIQQDDLSSSDGSKKRRRRGTFGSISRYLFPKARSRRSFNSSPYEGNAVCFNLTNPLMFSFDFYFSRTLNLNHFLFSIS